RSHPPLQPILFLPTSFPHVLRTISFLLLPLFFFFLLIPRPPRSTLFPYTTLFRSQAAESVLDLLRQSVRRRLVCDVAWGTFLSGGLDSSLITALAVAESPRPVKTFAIGFAEPTYDERTAAADVAARLGTEHHEVVLTPSGARELLPEVARIFDEPFADATALPAVLLARLARAHVTVALSGDGGDELFCGYPTQTAHGAADLYARVPAALHRAVAAAAERLPTSHRYLSFDFALRRFLREVRRPALERHLRWMG